jgi:hypothetical protein
MLRGRSQYLGSDVTGHPVSPIFKGRVDCNQLPNSSTNTPEGRRHPLITVGLYSHLTSANHKLRRATGPKFDFTEESSSMLLPRDVLVENLICRTLPLLNEINDTYGKSFP